MYPTQGWYIVEVDRQGQPRGFEKSPGKFYLDETQAHADHANMLNSQSFMVVPVVIMGDTEYRALVDSSTILREAPKLPSLPCENANVSFSLTAVRPNGHSITVEQDCKLDEDFLGNIEEDYCLSNWVIRELSRQFDLKLTYNSQHK